jgi:hypothetical protein
VESPLVEPRKRCPDCREHKPLDQFPRNRNYKDGRHPYCKPCHNARGKESKQRLHGGSRHYHLSRRYGISAAQAEELIRRQGGMCACCGERAAVHVDHDHETGEVRGMLCLPCNTGLGHFNDDLNALWRGIRYLQRWKAQREVQAAPTPAIIPES